jgi:hypothetical protein
MNAEEANFCFPVLGFTRDREIWGFEDLDRLTRCGPKTLQEGLHVDMELVDAERRRWRVLSVRRVRRAGSFLSTLLPFGPPQSRVEFEVETLDTIAIEDVRRRVSEAMEAHAENYFEGDRRDQDFEPLLTSVKNAGSVVEIFEILQPDTFEAN